MKKIKLLSSLFMAVSLFSQNIITPLQQANYLKVTSYLELSQFIKEVDLKSDLIKSEVLTKSIEGRELFAVYFSKNGFGKDKSKIRVLIFAQQHGNEQSGKEGALFLITELLKPENQYLFEKIDFVLIPQMNPDGSEKNKRRNGNDVDVNRNHLILTEPETIALHKLVAKSNFEVSMDVHEYSPYGESWKKFGYRRNIDEQIGTVTNINISQKIKDLSKKEYLPFIKNYLLDRKFTAFEYTLGGPPDEDYFRHSTFDINDGRQSLGIQNTFAFIQEGLNGEDGLIQNIAKRTKGQMFGMLGLLEFSFNNCIKIKRLIKEERDKLINNKVSNIATIQYLHSADGSKLEFPLLSYSSNIDTIITFNDYRPIVKSIYDVKRPIGYLVPKKLNDIVEWANKHSLLFSDYKKSKNQKIEEYHITLIDTNDFEGDTVLNPICLTKEYSSNALKGDYIFIPVKQLKNNTIIIALEPKSTLGLATYKKYSYLIKKGEAYPILRVVN